MLTCSLQSGSNGNAIYVEAGEVRLLFDAGISARRANQRLSRHHREMRHVSALILSHAHGDHTRCAPIYQRVWGMPIHGTPATLASIAPIFGARRDLRTFEPGEALEIDGVRVETIPTPHDAEQSVAFVIDHGGRRLGLFTDLGGPIDAIASALPTLDAVYLESNYDPDLLASGPYPEHLKARICGGGGHLSNEQSAHLLRRCARPRLQWAALAHLSEHNNHPQLALRTHRDILGDDFPLWIASRTEVSPLMPV